MPKVGLEPALGPSVCLRLNIAVVLFLLSLPDRSPVMADGASHGCTENRMVREMSRDAPDHRAFKASSGMRGQRWSSN